MNFLGISEIVYITEVALECSNLLAEQKTVVHYVTLAGQFSNILFEIVGASLSLRFQIMEVVLYMLIASLCTVIINSLDKVALVTASMLQYAIMKYSYKK